MVGLLALSSTAAGFVLAVTLLPGGEGPAPGSGSTATVHVETDRPGALVLVDGQVRGTTPLELVLPPGPRRLDVEAGGSRRSLGIDLAAGAQASYFFTLAVPDRRTSTQGGDRGAPARPGGDGPPATRQASPPAGLALVPLSGGVAVTTTGADTGPVPTAGTAIGEDGWLVVRGPVSVRVLEDGCLVGVSADGPLRLAAGHHQVEVVAEDLELRTVHRVIVPPGGTVSLDLPWPSGSASFNADPWAEVWVDGRHLGETPLANVALPIGRHEVVFRHPQMGDRRADLLVRRSTPSRVAVSFAR